MKQPYQTAALTVLTMLWALGFIFARVTQAQDGVPVQLTGVVESVSSTMLVVSQQPVDISSAEVLPTLERGMNVAVTGRLMPDGRVIASAVFLLQASAVTPTPALLPTRTPVPEVAQCPRDSRFWSSTTEDWPVASLMLGEQTYAAQELLAFLNTPVNSDASRRVARSLIITKLNIAAGTSAQPIADAISEADLLLTHFSGKLPFEVLPTDELGPAMISQAEVLDSYNSRLMTPGCVATTPVPTGTGLIGEYFDNEDLTVLLLTRTDPTVNFNWGQDAPIAGMGTATFSERWTGYVVPLYSETYTFYTYSDDGVRLWVNDQPLIDDWTRDEPTENSGTIALEAGQPYAIRLEHFENGGGALIQLSWSSARQPKEIIPQSQLLSASPMSGATAPTILSSGTGQGLTGEYFDDNDLTDLLFTRVDSEVNFDWGRDAPMADMGTESFSVRWTGYIVPLESDTYTFYTYSDDGVRLWVNGFQLINNWTRHDLTENHGALILEAGHQYPIRLEYYEDGHEAKIRLSWSSARQPEQIIPSSQLVPAATAPDVPMPATVTVQPLRDTSD